MGDIIEIRFLLGEIKMKRLVQRINFGYGDMFVYGEADFEANQSMQEPLEKLFNYEESFNKEISDSLIEYLDKTVFYKYHPCNIIDDIKTALENYKS